MFRDTSQKQSCEKLSAWPTCSSDACCRCLTRLFVTGHEKQASTERGAAPRTWDFKLHDHVLNAPNFKRKCVPFRKEVYYVHAQSIRIFTWWRPHTPNPFLERFIALSASIPVLATSRCPPYVCCTAVMPHPSYTCIYTVIYFEVNHSTPSPYLSVSWCLFLPLHNDAPPQL